MQTRVETWNGEKLRAFRQHLHYSQREMAEELGVNTTKICLWEADKQCVSGTAIKLLSLLAERAGFVYLPEKESDE